MIRLLRGELREVSLEEIKGAATAWAEEQRSNPRAWSYRKSAGHVILVAKKWLPSTEKLQIGSNVCASLAGRFERSPWSQDPPARKTNHACAGTLLTGYRSRQRGRCP